jgi:UDP-GlcNAc3NAcA epimerase
VRVATVVGARPQFIKAAAVSRSFRSHFDAQELLIHTGQHYDENMSDVFFDELAISRPDYYLNIGSGTHGQQTGRMLEAIERVFLETSPDWVLVYGDTNSTLAGALAAAKMRIPLAHVEAGLRSLNRQMPEETNRVLTDHASDLLLAPTKLAVENLRREGIPDKRIYQVGDVMYDAALHFATKAQSRSQILEQLRVQSKRYILASVHRSENTDDPSILASILGGLSKLAAEMPVVLPLHPRTQKAVRTQPMLKDDCHRISILDPVGYLDMAMLEMNARLIATDSGGVQREAFFYRVPCVTLRHETEWQELIELGWNRLAPPRSADLVAARIREALADGDGREGNPYGDGHAADRVVQVLMNGNSGP